MPADFELTAQASSPRNAWKKQVSVGTVYSLGRDATADLQISWDNFISRSHAEIVPQNNGVHVRRQESSQNPLFYDGEEVASCVVQLGECFVVGETVVYVAEASESAEPSDIEPFKEFTFNRQQLRQVQYDDADKRLDALTHLPQMILGSRADSELDQQLVSLLLAGVPHAEAVGIVEWSERDVDLIHWERRHEAAGKISVSRRLVEDSLENRQSSVLHIWQAESAATNSDYTATAEFDWAFCTPVPHSTTVSRGLYVAGGMENSGFSPHPGGSKQHFLEADVKFTEVVAEIVGSLKRVNKLERRQAGLSQFFAPPILKALGDDWNIDFLEPRECDVTVMFCDLRGFSRKAEGASGDDLLGLLDRVSRALGVMNTNIHEFGGVTGDFQGDATLGFWGWPFASSDSSLNACRAALKIRADFEAAAAQEDHPLADFRMGIGIARGRAVAGKIGTADQVKVTVFGPVVNLASRLEGMTKQLRVPIAIDEATAESVRSRLDSETGRLRKLGCVLPVGFEIPVDVSELLPPLSEYGDLSDEDIARYEDGVEHFRTGNWDEAFQKIHSMPASDLAHDFLVMHIAKHNRVAPADWDGVLRLVSK